MFFQFEYDNLIEFDLKIVEGIREINNKMSELIVEIDSNGENKVKLISEVKSAIIDSRNQFIERMQYVGGFD